MGNLPPFYVGQKVVTISTFEEVRRVWGFNYPQKDSIVEVLSIKKHPKHNFWLITVPGCECELCHKSFAPIETGFKAISLTKIIEKETSLVGVN